MKKFVVECHLDLRSEVPCLKDCITTTENMFKYWILRFFIVRMHRHKFNIVFPLVISEYFSTSEYYSLAANKPFKIFVPNCIIESDAGTNGSHAEDVTHYLHQSQNY